MNPMLTNYCIWILFKTIYIIEGFNRGRQEDIISTVGTRATFLKEFKIVGYSKII